MADQKKVYPNGEDEFTLTSGDLLTARVTGEGVARIYQKKGYPNYPDAWDEISTIRGTGSFTGGPYTSDLTFRIEAGSDPVFYEYGATLAAGGASDPLVTPWFPNQKVGSIIEYYEDFLDAGAIPADPVDSIDWEFTVVEAGAGDAAIALDDAQGGVITITNDAADNDRVVAAKNGEAFKFVSGKKTWFRAKFKVSDADDVDAFMGLVIQTATDPVGTAPTDGVWFQLAEADADGGLDLVVSKDSTATTQAVATVADATFIDVAFVYDGADAIQVYADDAHIAEVATTNLPDDEELSIFFAIQNGDAAADTMSIDYIYAAQER